MSSEDYSDEPTPDPYADDILALVRTGDWLDAQDFPPLRWAVHGLIPEGFGLLTGPPKAGKSWAALGIALAVACGGKALGKVPTGRARPVLYLALEDGNARLQSRCRKLLVNEPIPHFLHTATSVNPETVIPLIQLWLDRNGWQAPLVLLDTLGKVMPPSKPGEGAYQRDYRIGSTLKRLSDAHPGTTLLVVHHIRKQGGEDWMDSTSGTNGLNGAADFTVNLHRARNEEVGIIRVTGRDVAEGEYAVTSRDGYWTIDGTTLADAAQAALTAKVSEGLGERASDIVDLLRQHPEGLGPTNVGAAMGISPSNAGTYLKRLADADRILHAGRGVYKPLPASVESVESVETEAPISTLSTVSTPPRRCPRHGTDYQTEACWTCEQIEQGRGIA